ncbi:hypothetical protein ACHAXR_012971 [Thalassiosira sp. AJA248-18]
MISQLDYTGGLTNHPAAIQMCQQAFPSFGGRNNFLLLVTDDVSSAPDSDAQGAAELAATSAKLDGTFIIPVFIRGRDKYCINCLLTDTELAFMRRLSSDGKVFVVTDFDSLNSLQDQLVEEFRS